MTPEIAEEQHARALETLDEVVALAQDRFKGDVIIVASQSTGSDTGPHPEGLGPIVISGEGWDGYLTSSSTQRSGVVTNLDVTATALEVLGLERPVQVLGNSMITEPAPADLESRVRGA